MQIGISHDREEETLEAKARWIQSLSMTERLDLLSDLSEFLVSIKPELAQRKHAQPIPGRVCILELP